MVEGGVPIFILLLCYIQYILISRIGVKYKFQYSTVVSVEKIERLIRYSFHVILIGIKIFVFTYQNVLKL